MDLILLQDSSFSWYEVWQGVTEKVLAGLFVAGILGLGVRYIIERNKNRWALMTEVNKVK